MHRQSQNNPITPFYLHNFQILADFVFTHYEPLLSASEHTFYLTFRRQPESAQYLYVRLLMRRGEYIRRSKINYPEVDSLSDTLAQLLSEGFLTAPPTECIPDWPDLFTRDELASTNVYLSDDDAAPCNAPDLFGDTPADLLQQLDTVYEITYKAEYQIFLLLFFGNIHQDLSEFVLRDLGLRNYENYLTDNTSLPFKSRCQLLAYLQYYHCAETYDEACELGSDGLYSLFLSQPTVDYNDPILRRRNHKLYNHIARQLEREAAFDQAAEIYRLSDYPPARERLARIEFESGNDKTALSICDDILQNPANTEEQEFAIRFSHKARKRLGIQSKAPIIYKPPQQSIELTPSRLPVEHAAALHYAKTGHCHYVENSLFTAALGLVFWDIIFAPVAGMFFNPFQRAPLDFYDPSFTHRRQALIDNRLTSITQGKLREHLFTHFHSKRGILNPLVNWSAVNYAILAQSVAAIPTADWLTIFGYLLSDLKCHRCGLPDLIYFPNTGGYQLLEVKGPGDTLQQHQRRWLQYFSKHNISHAVVKVTYVTTTQDEQPRAELATC